MARFTMAERKKRCRCRDECESSVTMSVRCRRGHLMLILGATAVLAFVSNFMLLAKHSRKAQTPPALSAFLPSTSKTSIAGDSLTKGQNPNNTIASTAVARLRSLVGFSSEDRNLFKQGATYTHKVKKAVQVNRRRRSRNQRTLEVDPRPESLSAKANFAACLLIKDDNEILSEWIAYHYHVLKLRRLVVAVDPSSTSSPSLILQKWRLMTDLDILEWTDQSYMPVDFLETGKPPKEYVQDASEMDSAKVDSKGIMEVSIHRYRQRVFLARCMKTLRDKGHSWVMHIDTDEYVVASKLLRQMNPGYIKIPSTDEPGSVLTLLQQVVGRTPSLVTYPCISMLRVLFGSVESRHEDRFRNVPPGFNATRFETFRWRYHALPHNMTIHGNPKVIIDVSAIPKRYFPNHLVYSIHRPVKEFCPRNKDLSFTNFRKQPIAANHYLGSWERYNGRHDKRRSRATYDAKANVNRGKDDGVRPWLQGFVKVMGRESAAQLLGTDYLMEQEEEKPARPSQERKPEHEEPAVASSQNTSSESGQVNEAAFDVSGDENQGDDSNAVDDDNGENHDDKAPGDDDHTEDEVTETKEMAQDVPEAVMKFLQQASQIKQQAIIS